MTLHERATEGDLEGLRRDLKDGISVDDRVDGWTPLMRAAKSDNASVEVLRLLVEHGANVNADRNGKERPLGLAIRAGALPKVAYLISNGAQVTYRTSSGYDALIDAAHAPEESKLELVCFLLAHGARVDGTSKYNETALKVASRMVRMDVVKVLLRADADETQLGWGPLAKAVALGTTVDVEGSLSSHGVGPARDVWNRTPWMLSLSLGALDKAKLLFAAGVDREDRGLDNASALSVAAAVGASALVEWLLDQGFSCEDANDHGSTPLMSAVYNGHIETVRALLRRGANPNARHDGNSAMSCVRDRATFDALLNAGGEIADVGERMRRALRGTALARALKVTPEDFHAGKTRRFGRANPELMKVPFWNFMVISGSHAYSARAKFAREERALGPDPVWCYSRFGQSITLLPDGRVIEIGGEHEDDYHAEFCIYNDVVVSTGEGQFTVYGYPKEIFPPTDFHTATSFDGSIYIVGALGYAGERGYGTTPVHRLDCATFAIEKIATTGPCPGWINRHRASLSGSDLVVRRGAVLTRENGKDVSTDNNDVFVLNLRERQWRKTRSDELVTPLYDR